MLGISVTSIAGEDGGLGNRIQHRGRCAYKDSAKIIADILGYLYEQTRKPQEELFA